MTQEEFSGQYETHVRRIYAYLYYRTLHRETAEDLAAQAFLKAFERLESFDAAKGTFAAWLYAIARNLLTDHFRARRETIDIDDVWDLRNDDDVEADAEKRLLLEKIRPHLQALEKGQRELLLLRLWDGLSYAEIAELTGRTEAASKMAFSRAIAKLRKNAPALALLLFLTPRIL